MFSPFGLKTGVEDVKVSAQLSRALGVVSGPAWFPNTLIALNPKRHAGEGCIGNRGQGSHKLLLTI